MTQKKLLYDVVIARPFLIFLLVFYHSFAIYVGTWAPIDGQSNSTAYWWLGKLSYAIMLEMFVFISGYVLGYQSRKGRGQKKKIVLVSKLKRLMLPCALFSLLYIILFFDIRQPIYKTLYGMVNGVGHLWFLPMLFWLFMGVAVIERFKIKTIVVFPISLLLAIFSYSFIPFRIGYSFYYFPFFYIGYILQREDINIVRYCTSRNLIHAVISFCLLFPLLTLLKETIKPMELLPNHQLSYFLKHAIVVAIQYVYSFSGLIAFWIIVERIILLKSDLPACLVKFGNLCFGIYLLQEFVLRGLYYHTSLPSVIGFSLLPWFGFLIALACSTIITYILLMTRIGRFIIG